MTRVEKKRARRRTLAQPLIRRVGAGTREEGGVGEERRRGGAEGGEVTIHMLRTRCRVWSVAAVLFWIFFTGLSITL
jgi:hypothetical protein